MTPQPPPPRQDRADDITGLLRQLAELLAHPPPAHPQPALPEPAAPVAPVLLTPEQAARALGIGRTTLYRLLATGEITSVRIGRLRRIPRDALSAYAARLTTDDQNSAA